MNTIAWPSVASFGERFRPVQAYDRRICRPATKFFIVFFFVALRFCIPRMGIKRKTVNVFRLNAMDGSYRIV